jgi:predicted nucleotidyltransferase
MATPLFITSIQKAFSDIIPKAKKAVEDTWVELGDPQTLKNIMNPSQNVNLVQKLGERIGQIENPFAEKNTEARFFPGLFAKEMYQSIVPQNAGEAAISMIPFGGILGKVAKPLAKTGVGKMIVKTGEKKILPTLLKYFYHGTDLKNLESIAEKGLEKTKMGVGLTEDLDEAKFYGKSLLLRLNKKAIKLDSSPPPGGFMLQNKIPPEYLEYSTNQGKSWEVLSDVKRKEPVIKRVFNKYFNEFDETWNVSKPKDIGWYRENNQFKFNEEVQSMISKVSNYVKKKDPAAKVYVHGSWTLGTAKKASDLDLYVKSNILSDSELDRLGKGKLDSVVSTLDPNDIDQELEHFEIINPIEVTQSLFIKRK